MFASVCRDDNADLEALAYRELELQTIHIVCDDVELGAASVPNINFPANIRSFPPQLLIAGRI